MPKLTPTSPTKRTIWRVVAGAMSPVTRLRSPGRGVKYWPLRNFHPRNGPMPRTRPNCAGTRDTRSFARLPHRLNALRPQPDVRQGGRRLGGRHHHPRITEKRPPVQAFVAGEVARAAPGRAAPRTSGDVLSSKSMRREPCAVPGVPASRTCRSATAPRRRSGRPRGGPGVRSRRDSPGRPWRVRRWRRRPGGG